jgi:hypothetical protein
MVQRPVEGAQLRPAELAAGLGLVIAQAEQQVAGFAEGLE